MKKLAFSILAFTAVAVIAASANDVSAIVRGVAVKAHEKIGDKCQAELPIIYPLYGFKTIRFGATLKEVYDKIKKANPKINVTRQSFDTEKVFVRWFPVRCLTEGDLSGLENNSIAWDHPDNEVVYKVEVEYHTGGIPVPVLLQMLDDNGILEGATVCIKGAETSVDDGGFSDKSLNAFPDDKKEYEWLKEQLKKQNYTAIAQLVTCQEKKALDSATIGVQIEERLKEIEDRYHRFGYAYTWVIENHGCRWEIKSAYHAVEGYKITVVDTALESLYKKQ